jgi:hypothetical protein
MESAAYAGPYRVGRVVERLDLRLRQACFGSARRTGHSDQFGGRQRPRRHRIGAGVEMLSTRHPGRLPSLARPHPCDPSDLPCGRRHHVRPQLPSLCVGRWSRCGKSGTFGQAQRRGRAPSSCECPCSSPTHAPLLRFVHDRRHSAPSCRSGPSTASSTRSTGRSSRP